MRSLAEQLQWLGFEPRVDFRVQDDGEGPYIAEWMSEGPQPSPEAIAAAMPPVVAAQRQVIAMIDAATASILDAYPRAERLGWDAKANEARIVLAAGESATLSLAPLLVAECEVEHGAADGAARLAQLVGKAQSVATKAAAWGVLMATLSGIRIRAFAAIDAAADATELQAAIEEATAEVDAAAAPPD